MKRPASKLALGAAFAALFAPAAFGVHLNDTYWGGLNSYNPSNGDVIGALNTFDILGADVTRNGTNLQVVINTNFAGKAGTEANIGYGALFFRSGGILSIPEFAASNSDTYQAGRFDYAFVIPQTPGQGNQGGSFAAGGTSGGLFQVNEAGIVRSNVNGNPISYPNANHAGYYFRQNQAVQYTPVNNQTALRGGDWLVDQTTRTITFTIENVTGLLGSTFALAWAMTCGNDVIFGNVTLPGGGQNPVPIPGALVLFASGAGLLGAVGWRRRSRAAA